MAKNQVNNSPDFIPDEQAHKFGLAPAPQSPDFIPDEEAHKFGLAQPPEVPALEKARIFGENAVNNFALGYLPQIEGGIKSAFSDKPYVEERDAVLRRLAEDEKKAPGYATAGNVAGLLGSVLVPGGVIPKVGKAGAILGTALQGGLYGLISNPGDKEGIVDPGQGEERFRNAAKSGALSAALGGAGAAVSKAASVLGEKLGTTADELAVRGLGAAKPDVKKLGKLESIDRQGENLRALGKFARDNKLVQAGNSIESVADKTFALQKKTGQKLGDIYETVNSKLKDPDVIKMLPASVQKALTKTDIYPKEAAKYIESEITKSFKGTPGGQQAIARVQSELENLRQLPDNVPLSTFLKFRQQLDDVINFQDPKPVQKALKEMRTLMQKQIDLRIKVLDKGTGGDKLSELKRLNKTYSQASKAADIVKNRISGTKGNNFLSLVDSGYAAAGGLAGYLSAQNPEDALTRGLMGAAAGLASKGVRKYSPGLLMQGAAAGSAAANKLAPLGAGLQQNAGLIAPRLLLNREAK